MSKRKKKSFNEVQCPARHSHGSGERFCKFALKHSGTHEDAWEHEWESTELDKARIEVAEEMVDYFKDRFGL